MISVIIPLYNKATTIHRAIDSVLRQTLLPDEILVVDDGSSDDSIAHLPTDSRIRVIKQSNAGASVARNHGIEEAKGDLVAFLDADDEWKPEFLQVTHHLTQQFPDCNLFATAYEQLDAAGETHSIRLNRLPFLGREGILSNYFEVAAHSDPPICSISLLVRRKAIQKIGGFPVGIRQGEDLLTWAKLAFNNRVAYSTQSLAIFHNDGNLATETPKRIPPQEDVVGQQLQALYAKQPSTEGLREYLAHWHKMRASIYLRLPHQAHNCRKEIRLSREWYPNKKLRLYSLLLWLPYGIRIRLIKHLK